MLTVRNKLPATPFCYDVEKYIPAGSIQTVESTQLVRDGIRNGVLELIDDVEPVEEKDSLDELISSSEEEIEEEEKMKGTKKKKIVKRKADG